MFAGWGAILADRLNRQREDNNEIVLDDAQPDVLVVEIPTEDEDEHNTSDDATCEEPGSLGACLPLVNDDNVKDASAKCRTIPDRPAWRFTQFEMPRRP